MVHSKSPTLKTRKNGLAFVYTLLAAFVIITAAAVVYPVFKYAMMSPQDHLRAGLSAYQLKDYKSAGRHLKAASQQNDAAAFFILGLMQLTGQGMPKDAKSAAVNFEKSANLGYRHGQYMIALLYDRGEGVIENKQKALNWALLAAAQGDREATYASAVWLERGYSGKSEPFLAVSLYEKAAEQGHVNAMKSLISIYGGDAGVPKNKERAEYWMNKLQETVQKD